MPGQYSFALMIAAAANSIENDVISVASFREICSGVVDKLYCTQRADLIQIYSTANAGNVGSKVFSQLNS